MTKFQEESQCCYAFGNISFYSPPSSLQNSAMIFLNQGLFWPIFDQKVQIKSFFVWKNVELVPTERKGLKCRWTFPWKSASALWSKKTKTGCAVLWLRKIIIVLAWRKNGGKAVGIFQGALQHQDSSLSFVVVSTLISFQNVTFDFFCGVDWRASAEAWNFGLSITHISLLLVHATYHVEVWMTCRCPKVLEKLEKTLGANLSAIRRI